LKQFLENNKYNLDITMWTKSYIQLQVEKIEERSIFVKDIIKIMEKYQIQDGVFGIANKNTYELSKGYFVETKSFDDLNDLIKEMDQNTQAVRITEGKFILGNVYNNLTDITENCDNIFSIEYLTTIK